MIPTSNCICTFCQHNFPPQINKSLSHTEYFIYFYISSINDWANVTKTKFILKNTQHKTKITQFIIVPGIISIQKKRQSVISLCSRRKLKENTNHNQ